ncbi:glycine receptor subunit alpha-3-like [Argiope bruennichi]|uniref:glycine receptor subunit alpha-3-like n=1 Tax=Argiope bruennichi TaxID=94029 RepID=UPI0024957E25|nr:glycine receptor subunit alpha-3-like [Argiope bruennichi]
MNFKDYPFDTQLCEFPIILMDSHFFNVTLKWRIEYDAESLCFIEDNKPLQFFFSKPVALTKKEGLAIRFVFVRQLMGSFINIFMPSTLIVTVSWVSFWIRVEAAPARVALSVTSLLTLCTQIQNHRSLLPPLNYIIALDIWLFVCIFMVFANLVEFAISYNSYVIKRVNSFRDPKENGSAQRKAWIVNVDEDGTTSETISQSSKFQQYQGWLCDSSCGDVTRIDLACRMLFPLTFSVFSVAYWWHYLTIYNYQKIW